MIDDCGLKTEDYRLAFDDLLNSLLTHFIISSSCIFAPYEQAWQSIGCNEWWYRQYCHGYAIA